MKEFSVEGFAAHLLTLMAAEEAALHAGLKKCAQAIEATAKEEIGFYQPDVGSFPAWQELSDFTKTDRLQQGYTENDPLLRSGELRDSISHVVEREKAVIGSTSDVMVYQELGTPSIPPRAVLGPAALHNKELIERTLGHAAVEGLLYGAGETWTKLE